ncbi:hypothetical protein M758_7G161300 [Ceratodon purpureus]|nr:hypothetical protein M758_7G161300 [Ceratodon purpureus]
MQSSTNTKPVATKTNVHGAATALKTTTFRVSVLRCKRTGRVLFLEAEKDFVDAIFSSLLELPVGTIIHMLSSAGVNTNGIGGISSLFKSVKQLDGSLLHVDKEYLLQPAPGVTGTYKSIGLFQGLSAAKLKSFEVELPKGYYGCNSNACYNLSSTAGTPCNPCRGRYHNGSFSFAGQLYSIGPGDLEKAKKEIVRKFSDDSVKKGACPTDRGFVRDSITYMVTDQLEIMPSITVKDTEVLNKLKVATLSDLESSDFAVNINQILQLLQSAMNSTTCLNDVFGKK